MIDMRKLTPEARQERRRQVIRLRQQSWAYEAIAAELGLSRTGVFDICRSHPPRSGSSSKRTASNMPLEMKSNNEKFNENLEEIVEQIFS